MVRANQATISLKLVSPPGSQSRPEAPAEPEASHAALALDLAAAAPIREVHVTFDSGFERELLLTPSHHHQKISAPRGAQTKIVRHYRVKIDGVVVHEETNNILRKRIHRLPGAVTGRTVEIECIATHGTPVARVFEVRCYT